MKRLIILACLTLAACGAPTEDEAEKAEQAGARETPFDPLTDQLDRAKAVEETVEQHKRDLDEAIEEAEDERR